MDIPTRNLSKYVKNTGVNLSKMSRETGIPYMSIYDSLVNDSRNRDLRVGEYMKICIFLERDPKDFAGAEEG